MKSENLTNLVISALEDLKAQDITTLPVGDKTTIADTMIIATGTSARHVGSIANEVVMKAKSVGHQPLGIEGQSQSNWVLVDLTDVIVHVMTQKARDFYELEKLWSIRPDGESAANFKASN